MNAKKCDICGKFYEEINLPKVIYHIMRISISGMRILDLCPECHEHLRKYAECEHDETGSGGDSKA